MLFFPAAHRHPHRTCGLWRCWVQDAPLLSLRRHSQHRLQDGVSWRARQDPPEQLHGGHSENPGEVQVGAAGPDAGEGEGPDGDLLAGGGGRGRQTGGEDGEQPHLPWSGQQQEVQTEEFRLSSRGVPAHVEEREGEEEAVYWRVTLEFHSAGSQSDIISVK